MATDTQKFDDDASYQPRHRQLFDEAVGTLRGVLSSVEWQREHIDSSFRDRRPAMQPPACDGNRNHHIDPERLREPAQKLQRAVVEVNDSGSSITKDNRVTLAGLIDRGIELEEEAYEIDRYSNLDGKEELAEVILEYAEDVREHIESVE